MENLTQVARTLLDHQVVPVVLSPFVFGARRADRLARHCNEQLQKLFAALPKAFYVNAYSGLNRQPRCRMLVRDGCHLSLEGQRVVGEALFTCLKNILENHAWFLKPSATSYASKSGQP